MERHHRPLVLAICALTFVPAPCRAAEMAELTLPEALSRALAENRELAAFGYRLAEQDGRLTQAGLLSNPDLTLEVEDFAGSGSLQGFDRAETTLSLGWVLERQLRRRRIGAERAQAARIGLDAEILELEVASETADRFLACVERQAHLTAAQEAVALAEDAVDAARRRVTAGKAARSEWTRAEAELAIAQLERDDAEHELSTAYHGLAAQWGASDPGFERVSGDLLSMPATESFDNLLERLERNPKLARLASEQRLAEANLRLAEAKRWPSLRPGLGLRHSAASDDVALVAELKWSLPVFDRNQGGIAEQRAVLSRTRADADAVRVRIRMAVFQTYAELQHQFHRARTLREDIVPRLVSALEEMRRGYERGRYGYLELHALRTELLQARHDLIETSADAHRLVISLERLTGGRVAAR